MQSAISGHLFLYHDLVTDRVIETIAANGFSMIELWAMQPHLPYRDDKKIGEIAAIMKKHRVSASSAHLPMYEKIHAPKEPRLLLSPSDLDEGRRKRWINELGLATKVAASLGAKVMTLHSDLDFPRPSDKSLTAFHKSMDALLESAPPTDFRFAVENNPGGLEQVEGVLKVINRYPTDTVGMTLDIGHAHIGGVAIEAVRLAASRLLSIHAHDNDGVGDDHLEPGSGSVPWDALKMALLDLKFDGPLVWEIRDPTAGDDPGLKLKSKMLKEIKKFDATFARS